jgi:amidohydrolase
MPVRNSIAAMEQDLTEWRHHLHAYPELSFNEIHTSAFVAEKLAEWGVEIHRGWASTGIVGVLHGKSGSGQGPTIGLRADMDALPIQEESDLAHASTREGVMHACGHDGHTTMLLGAARYLAENPDFEGTVCFIFQPAEENGGGADVMLKDGLFETFPIETVWGLHNSPHMPFGTLAWRSGAAMAAVDDFDIVIHGKGGHAARPSLAIDPIAIGCQLHHELETLVRRKIESNAEAVVTVTQFQAGDAYNVIPATATLRGTIRSYDEVLMKRLGAAIDDVCHRMGSMTGTRIDLTLHAGYPPLVNDPEATAIAGEVANRVVGAKQTVSDAPAVMGAEDFAFMLRQKPGAYIWMGTAEEGRETAQLHHPQFDFNDGALTLGTEYWVALVEKLLPRK